MSKVVRYSVSRLVDDDIPRDNARSGRPKRFGFGYRYMMRMGRVERTETIAAALARGIPLHEPAMLTAWAFARRGKASMASEILREFGYSTRFRVRRRTIVSHGPT